LRHAIEEKDGIGREIEIFKVKQEEMRNNYEKINGEKDAKIEEIR